MPDAPLPSDLALLRAEIDALDDAMHDLLMRRAAVVATLAASRAKGAGPALRPGREAAILRRLLGRHHGPLPHITLFRMWRELLGATTAMQSPLGIAAALDTGGMASLRAHFGAGPPVSAVPDADAALAALRRGEAALAALPDPAASRWWCGFAPGDVFVVARFPFLGTGDPVLLVSPAFPDASGDDATLVRLPAAGAASRLADAGLAPRSLVSADGHALASLPGFLMQDRRLDALGAVALGAYATPLAAMDATP
jgi:chorismate mutase